MIQRLPVFDRRRAGALLHLGSLDSALGRGGRAFIDWLAAAGFSTGTIFAAVKELKASDDVLAEVESLDEME